MCYGVKGRQHVAILTPQFIHVQLSLYLLFYTDLNV